MSKIANMWNRLSKQKILRPVMLQILFVGLCGMLSSGCGELAAVAELSTESTAQVQMAEAIETETQESIEEVAEREAATELIETEDGIALQTMPSTEVTLSVTSIPEYSGSPYVAINDNTPQFAETDLVTSSYEYYSDLDSLGRCGVVYACIGTDLMPTEERGNIGSVKPTGWHTIKYDIVDGKYLYNRCHLIGYQLSGENANTKNLITGTRYLNVDGMLPFENMVADYVKETNNHVMYRVTPVFEGDNLVASGVQIEAQSVEDNGEGILFNVYCYNVQPGVEIDYATGESQLAEDASGSSSDTSEKTTDASDEATGTSNETINAESSATSSVSENTSSASDEAIGSSDDSGTGGSDTLMVWKSATGKKYHSRNDCGNMNPDNATQITEEEAISQGLGKCSKCW